MCNVHPQECIEFLCKNCKKTICDKCTLYHRTCDSVVEINSQIGTMRTELKKKQKTLSKKQEDMISKTNELKSTLNIQTSRYKQMEENIMSLTLEVIEEIKVKERKLLDDLKEISDSHIGPLKAHIKSRELSAQMCQEEAELIDEALRSEDDKSVYMMYEGCEAGDVETVGDMFPMSEKGRIGRVTFLQDNEKLSKALEHLELGEFDVFYDGVVDLTAHPVLQDTIDVRIPENRGKGWIADVTVIVVDGVDTIVVTDRNNSNLNSFYFKNKQLCHNRLILSSAPWSLTKMTHNPLAVTVPCVKQIITVKVGPDLELLSTIQTSKQYWGITCLNPSLLAAGSKSPPCVDILDLTGTVLHSISPDLCGKSILQCPNYLCTTRKGNILVSDGATRCVVCLTPEGEIVFHYKPAGEKALKCPQGITSTCKGDILVTDFSLNKVIHLTESGEFVRDILTSEDGIEKPLGVDVDGRSQMYVCLQNQDAVKIFLS
ncbi:uncharacterized protein LOC124271909 [Haliotis rubra]|uniref:uncharacterized protein LOC124271909 n=1 Tax=Haliotis rubra TaxID=36100 RepID=UPI001EE632B4|nr:uncharacterized protein LOC124271909 [Haliotis rubra]